HGNHDLDDGGRSAPVVEDVSPLAFAAAIGCSGAASPAERTGRPMTAPAVRLIGLHKRFGEFVAVQPLDLEVASGTFFSIIGPSGCGKTTTLRMIAGLET